MLAWIKKMMSVTARSANTPSDSPVVVVPQGEVIAESAEHKRLGDACIDEGNWDEAVRHFQKAVQVSPRYAEAHGNLGFALVQQQQFGLAEHHLNIALSLKPDLFNSFYVLATIAHQLGDIDAAIAHFKSAISIKPDFVEALSLLGNLYDLKGARREAFDAYRIALEFDPYMIPALFNIAGILESQGSHSDAIACYRRALEVSPDNHSIRLALLHQLMQICMWNDLDFEIDLVRRAIRETPLTADSSDSPFAFLSLPGTTEAEQKRCAEKWVFAKYQSQRQLREALHFSFDRKRTEKPHIAYLSADFRDHATTRLMAAVFALHDHSRFKITAYSYGPEDTGDSSERLKTYFDSFVDIRGESDLEAAKRIYRDNVDILIDLKGYTENTRSAILAFRPAPIQVNFLGYPGTMGADFVDYLIADRFLIPEDRQRGYAEKIAYMPHTYQPNDRSRARPQNPGREKVGLPETGVVFCCFNQTYKITPEIFNIWCDLLKEVPDSVFWLLACNEEAPENLRREAINRGINKERFIFASRVSAIDHLARHQCADLFLDTIPVNAHTTCSDALWMGLPVITIAGDTFPSRVAGSLLSAIGLPELITHNLEDYRALALDLALNDQKRREIQAKIIANRDAAPLYDSELFTRDLESLYDAMLNISK